MKACRMHGTQEAPITITVLRGTSAITVLRGTSAITISVLYVVTIQ